MADEKPSKLEFRVDDLVTIKRETDNLVVGASLPQVRETIARSAGDSPYRVAEIFPCGSGETMVDIEGKLGRARINATYLAKYEEKTPNQPYQMPPGCREG